ncbi:glycine betaine/L-proline ABC transporter substrate-binding protein ProX [Falsirhodobacter sp. 20TX0035]|uniref:glycine betaine/L-proline ABC transporter substrate-binding protein ProX n=1 Tax=Falsirhodobacter sp. 20TX0035 TaxID=3022019 RepID=UPI00232CE0FB|nr:glycine betaine/L-proline ABC transporter substrate-binding protein ProX [Falsirhodobacter sp. 20TX0035]MDB6454256.1 glycine betaine/L-proline ABC transporter substrate-binding protein ProX [Falsirhodobacter sp. 20TX0035]
MKTPTLILAALLSTAAPVLAQDLPGDGKTVNLARPTWDTSWFHTEIYKQLLKELGYTVNGPQTLDNPPFYQAVAYGDVDMWLDGWFPLHDTYRPIFEESAEVVGAVAPGGAMEGYLVDKAAADELGITSLDDFKRPEVREAFDRNGDGKADMVACPPGWGCEVGISEHIEGYELGDDINLIKAGYAAAMADAVAAYQGGEHILFYTWTPNWTLNELVPGEDVVWIQVPDREVDLNLAPAEPIADIDGCVANPCRLGYPASDISAVVNTNFLEDNPAIRELLEAAEIPVKDIYTQNAAMNAGDDDIEAQAADWIEKNRDTVDGWIKAAVDAKS